MKIVVFGPHKRVGALRGELVVDLSLACAKFLKERQNERHPTLLAAALVPSDLAQVHRWRHARARECPGGTRPSVRRRPRPARRERRDAGAPVSEVRLHAPRPNGSRIACAGGNFADHLAGMAAMGLLPGAGAMSIEQAAARIRDNGIWGFWKVDRITAGPDAEVPYPGRADRLDYEGEVAIVLGKQGKGCARGTTPKAWCGA